MVPAFSLMQDKKEINILDICYGLGFNTLATLYHHKKNSLTSKLNIYSPELDATLLSSLKNFTYPKEFEEFKSIILKLCKDDVYDDDFFHIEIFLGDAREYIKKFTNKFDIVYQDAFSPANNPTLWTLEYFSDLKIAMKKDSILTTYSIALSTRLALWQNGFYIYTNESKNIRTSSVASMQRLEYFKEVDMPHKIACNPDAKPLRD